MTDPKELRSSLERLDMRIAQRKNDLDALYAKRTELWSQAEAAGIPRSQLAKWSGVDPMMVTRALGPKEKA